MVFGRKRDPQDDAIKSQEKAVRDKAKMEAKEKKSVEREAKAQQRREEQKARAEEKLAREKRELELFGRKVLDEMCAGKWVQIYDKGYVKVSGMLNKNGAVFEKLRAISGSADVTKKTGLGRAIVAVPTMGLNLMTTPNKRGDMYLNITTERKTHSLHMSPPTEREMKAMHKIASAGQGVLDALERQASAPVATSSPTPAPRTQPPVAQKSAVDELTKLVELHDKGALTDAEFSAMKAKLISGN